MNPRWHVVKDPYTFSKPFMLENAAGAFLRNKKGRGSGVSRPRRWASKEAAQLVADELNEMAYLEHMGDLADAASY